MYIGNLLKREFIPDVVTDQTSAHDPLYGYIPRGYSVEKATDFRKNDQPAYLRAAMDSMSRHVAAMIEFQEYGSIVFDYGNNLRQRAFENGVPDAFYYPGFVPAYIRPLFCEGKGPFRWVALSGEQRRHLQNRRSDHESFP